MAKAKKIWKCLFVSIYFALNGSLQAQVYTITTIAGTGMAGFSNDGNPSINAMLYYPLSVSVDSTGSIYIADWGNSRVRKINSNGIINTIAGDGKFSFSGDGSFAYVSGLCGPTGVYTDLKGNIYIADIEYTVIGVGINTY